jgi:hypothetical protein
MTQIVHEYSQQTKNAHYHRNVIVKEKGLAF